MGRRGGGMTEPDASLRDLRTEIDALDRELVAVLARRFACVGRVIEGRGLSPRYLGDVVAPTRTGWTHG